MLQHSIFKHTLRFKRPSGTSRGILKTKDSWFIQLWDSENPNIIGIGECSIIKGLSPDPLDRLQAVLAGLEWTDTGLVSRSQAAVIDFPAVQFAVEMALKDLQNGGRKILFPSSFTDGNASININGLIWMGDYEFMRSQIQEKISLGFRCVKLKIGAIDFEAELKLLGQIRKRFSKDDIELRVDANGAFKQSDALEKLKRLSEHDIHSIEQPIRQGQVDKMAELCSKTPLPIALDEELIGVQDYNSRKKLIETIQPQYIILKPSLLGGFQHSAQWITMAEASGIGWWITSALESNIGLNAIAQWTHTLSSTMFQGLGTGGLFTNNVDSPLEVKGDQMFYNPDRNWGSINS